MPIPSTLIPPARFGPFEVDFRAGELLKNGRRIRLQDQPLQVLAMLLEHPGDVVTRDEFRQKLWPNDTFVDFDHGLNNAINRLRETLCDSAENPRYIGTLPRRGYRFVASVEPIPPVATIERAGVLSEIAASVAPSDGAPQQASNERAWPWRLRMFPFFSALAAVLITVLLVFTFGKLRTRVFSAERMPRIQSIAVLPFENLTGDTGQEYFVDGMTDALITDLAQIRSLRVISRTSVAQYKGAKKRLPEIARELNVDVILEGSVVRSNDQVRINAQLILAANDQHLWAKSYQSHLRDIVNVQSDIARAVAEEVQLRISPEEKARLTASRPANPDAYEAYLKGIYFQNRQTADDTRTGIRFFQTAIEKDPGYAAAYARLADCFMFLGASGEMSSAEASLRAREAAQKALTMDEGLVDAHIDVANIAFFRDSDWGKADAEFRRAVELNPNSARVHQAYAPILQILGRPKESAVEVRAARALEPVSLPSLFVGVFVSYLARQYDEALTQTQTALEVYPDAPLLHVFLSNIYFQQGQSERAAEESLRAEELWHSPPERIAALSSAVKAAGLKGFLRKRIELDKKLLTPEFQQAYEIAIDCAALGDRDQAIDWLESAYRVRDPKLPLIGVEPMFDSVRSDPRFDYLMRRVGLPVPK